MTAPPKKKTLFKQVRLAPSPGAEALTCTFQEALDRIHRCVNAGEYQSAGFMASQLMEKFPHDVTLRQLLAEAWMGIGRFDKAEPLITELLREEPRNHGVVHTAGNYYLRTHDGARARACMEKAVRLSPDDDHYHYSLGYVCRSTGRREEAIVALRRALALNPRNANAWWEYVLLTREDPAPGDREKVETLAESADLDPESRGLMNFTAALYFRDKDPDAEFEWLERANALLAARRPWDDDAEERRFRQIRAGIDPALIRQVTGGATSGAPPEGPSPVFIVAMPRSGTTLLEQVLGAHSAMHPVGESEALMRALQQAAARLQIRGGPWDWLESGTGAAVISRLSVELPRDFLRQPLVAVAGDRRVVDKSIGNLNIAGLIPLLYPQARVLYLRRHPLDVVLSCYRLYFPIGHHYIYRLESIAKRYRMYDTWMDELAALYPEQIRIVSYDDLVRDPEPGVRGIFDFCGLDWEEGCLDFHRRESVVETDGMLETFRPIHSGASGRWHAFRRHLGPAAQILGIDMDRE